MIDIVAARLAPQVERVVINANGDPGRFAALGLPVIADAGDSFEGPLAGVLAGLVWARATGNTGSHIVTVPVDSPFLPGNLVARLAVAGADASSLALGNVGAAGGGRKFIHKHTLGLLILP